MDRFESVRYSKWVHLFKDDSRSVVALFHALNIDVVYLPQQFCAVLDLLSVGTTLDFIIGRDFGDADDIQTIVTELFNRKFIVLVCSRDEFGLLAINLNPLLDTEQEKVDGAYLAKVNARIIEYFLLARQKGVYEERMMRKIKPFVSHRVRPFDCQATGGQVVCSPDGQLGICQEGLGMKNYFFGKASHDFDFCNHPVAQEWGKRSPLNMPQCFNCSAIGICGGGCAYGAFLRNGSIWSVDNRFCEHSLTTLRWIIWDIYDQMITQ